MESNSISAIVTDPPYGLGFMGKDWDAGLPHADIWAEVLRIAKPGAFLLAFGGTRTYHRLTCAIEDAGWEIRDCLSWNYGSGFPKSHNNFGIPGYGTALKPAWEPIILCMKPCDGTFAQNAEKWGQAGINIDASRIPTDDLKAYSPGLHRGSLNDDGWVGKDEIKTAPKGRWPANVMFDAEAAAMLDEQSGTLTSGRLDRSKITAQNKTYGNRPEEMCGIHDSSSGGASRFFYCAKTSSRERNGGLDGLPDIVGKRTQDGGDDTRGRPVPVNKNNHPTVKPLKLMEYLIKLVMPPKDGVLLDPFAGSGSTILAAKRLGFNAIGIEKQKEYAEIAKARIESLNIPKNRETDQLELFPIK
jgi:site-specific DNA-methyltransferase (adenine-specific)